jgi:hypothetical protein
MLFDGQFQWKGLRIIFKDKFQVLYLRLIIIVTIKFVF